VHRLLPSVQGAVLGKTRQFPGGDPFVVVRHRQVGSVPVAEDAQPLEFLPLDVDELGGIFATLLPHLSFVTSCFFDPRFFSTCSSIGSPWQSHPGV